MPFTEVMHKFKHGDLHSGSKSGPKVKNRAQAIAIMLSEKKEAEGGKKEYKPSGTSHDQVKQLRRQGKSEMQAHKAILHPNRHKNLGLFLHKPKKAK